MGQTWHDRFRLIGGQVKNPVLQVPDLMQNVVDSITQVQPDICCNLVISGATGV